MHISSTYRMRFLDITNLYSSIPIKDVIQIITSKLEHKSSSVPNIECELITFTHLTTTQNYLEFDNTFWQQHEGTPMGSPISSMLVEIFIQYLEDTHYPNLVKKRHIKLIQIYIDDILFTD
jgi:hypothetical protein